MDGRGRLAQSLNPAGPSRKPSGITVEQPKRRVKRRALARAARDNRFERGLERYAVFFSSLRFFRGGGLAASALIVVASITYGVVKGGHVSEIVTALKDAQDMAGNAAGFRITGIAFAGQKHINREEILARAGVTGSSSLLFLDVADARTRLMADPRIADATVLKLYPNRLQITITERQPFALWQVNGRVSVIADDGSVLEPYVSQPFVELPLLVGKGAEARASEFLKVLNQYPDLRVNVRASVLIAERRWNLRLKNGLDIKLPETDVTQALDRLAALDRNEQLSSRDITSIDLRLSDRVTVHLSDAAAQARETAAKEKAKQQKKGGSA
jgi:cell division protein FtsQ